MIYMLLWSESLALCVLAVLWAFTFWQQTRYRKLGVTALVLALLLTMGFSGVQLALSIHLAWARVTPNYLFYSLSFVVALLATAGVVLWRGFRKDGEQRRIAAWPQAHLGIAALAAFALYLTTMMTIDATMQMKLSNVRLEAGALAMSEAPPRPPDRDNAALVYIRAFERIDAAKKSTLYQQLEKSRKANSELLADTQDPLVREYLESLKPALDLVRRAAAMPDCAFERAYATPSLDMQLPELWKMRECSLLMAADARIRAATGNVKGALENVRAIQGLAEHISYEPIVISGLMSAAIGNIGVDTLETVLQTTEPSSTDLEALGNEESINFRRVYTRGLRGERAFGLSAFAALGEANDAEMIAMLSYGRPVVPSLLSGVALPYWRIYLMPADLRSFNAAVDEKKSTAQDSYKANQERVARFDNQQNEREGILTSILMPALLRAFTTFHAGEARQRLAAVARAVARYKAKNKDFPKDLMALVPEFIGEIPTDPFDDKPLRMKTHAEGVMLYSVGTDALDQNGLPPTKKEPNSNDIVLRIGKVDDAAASSTSDGKLAPKLSAPPKTGF